MPKSQKKRKFTVLPPREAVEEAAEAVQEKPKRKSFLAGLAQAVAPVAKAVIPNVAGLIPGVGPILKGVLSTLNDDEWFSEFKSGGATFNELLGDIPIAPSSNKLRNISGALLVHEASLLGQGSTPMVQKYSDMLLPTILAYVRDKTGDVLVSAEADYWDAFFNSSCLLALFYTLDKYIELQHDLPLNVPDLGSLCEILNPANYAAYVGIRDSLRDYLRVTIGLPYAWCEYLRWRFGTTFYSDNTGRAGLVMYDYNLRRTISPTPSWVSSPGLTPATLTTVIAGFKSALAATSRAVADLHLAYKDHAVRYNVEARHYDEKEYNLRCNLFNYSSSFYKKNESGSDMSSIPDLPGPMIYMDSRLDSSAAYQAITISTDTQDMYAPIHIDGQYVFWYNKATYEFRYGYTDPNNVVNSDGVYLPAGWRTCCIWADVTLQSRLGSIKKAAIICSASGGVYKSRMYERYVGCDFTSTNTTDAARKTAVLDSVEAYLGQRVLDSMQAHKAQAVLHFVQGIEFTGADLVAIGKPLAYDMAIVTWSQIESTHRMAMRNLIRGNYTHKISPTVNPAVTQPVNELVEEVAEEMVDQAGNL